MGNYLGWGLLFISVGRQHLKLKSASLETNFKQDVKEAKALIILGGRVGAGQEAFCLFPPPPPQVTHSKLLGILVRLLLYSRDVTGLE